MLKEYGFGEVQMRLAAARLIGVLGLSLFAHAHSANLPPNFVLETYAGGMERPVEMSWTSDGRLFVAEKRGKIWVIANGVRLPTPFIDIGTQVNGHADRGSLGMTVHPDFPATPWVYILHTYDPPETIGASGALAHNGKGQRVSRVIRVTANAATNFNTAVPGSTVVLVGTNSTWANIGDPSVEQDDLTAPWSCGNPGAYVRDCIPAEGISHGVGTLAFGPDGMLYVSIGDAATWTTVDARATRALSPDSLAGKVLRIDPVTGAGLATNPYWNGDAGSNRSKVWQLGLRNPYRLAIDPITGEIWTGDVGWTDWEELNHAPASTPGANFGWPCYEGGNGVSVQQGGYSTLAACQDFYANGNPVAAPYAYEHVSGIGGALIAGDFYDKTTWPAEYRGALFFGDYSFEDIGYAHITGNTVDIHPFASDILTVDLSVGPDGHLYLANMLDGAIDRIVYGGPTVVPVTGFSDSFASGAPGNGWAYLWNATSALGNSAGYQPLLWDGVSVYDSNGVAGLPDPTGMSYGHIAQASMRPGKGTQDGQTTDRYAIAQYTVSTGGNYSITNSSITHTGCASSDGVEVVILVNNAIVATDEVGQGATDNFEKDLGYLAAGAKIAVALGSRGGDACDIATIDWDITFAAGNPPVGSPPVATILTPTLVDVWAVHETVNYSGVATDPDDGSLTGASLAWEVILHHNTHEHLDYYNATGATGSFPFPDHGDNTYAELCLTATDSDGRSATDCVNVVPQTVTYIFDTVPSGLELVYTSEIMTTPFTVSDLPVGSLRLISAPASQGQYQFDSWSTGGPATQQLTIGNTSRSVVATYNDLGGTPQSFSQRVAAGADDAEQASSGAVTVNSSDLELVDEVSNQVVGIRFRNLALQPGAQVVDAYIQFATDEVSINPAALLIRTEATANSPAFTTAAGSISARPRSVASVAWAPAAWSIVDEAGAAQRTPNLAPVINEIISGSGWVDGNALSFIITGSGARVAEAFEGVPTAAPLLYVSYLVPSANTPPVVQISSPVNGAVFNYGDTVSFTGSATDAQDGSLSSTLEWVSSVDGILGTGASISVNDLSAGVHVIEARVTDSGTLTGSDSINVSIDVPTAAQLLSYRVGASEDDAEEAANGVVESSSSDLELVNDTTNQVVGIRFNGVAIEPGTEIESAYLQFAADETSSGTIALQIQGELSSDAKAFDKQANNISARPRTSASVAWGPGAWNTVGEVGALQRTPNLAPIISEIINSGTWANGNSLALIITGSGKRVAEAYNGVPALAPLLEITVATPAGNTAPVVAITAPADHTPFNQGDIVSFTASAQDAEQGNLGADIEWVSSIDGVIGAGASLNVSSLSIGKHSIIARVADSGGLIGSRSVAVDVITAGGTQIHEARVAASNDDAEQLSTGAVSINSYDIEMFNYVSGPPHTAVGLRFNNLPIPPGAQLSSAWIQFSAQANGSAATSMTIQAHKTANAPVFTTALNNLTSRPRTTAAVTWATPPWVYNDEGAAQRTPDLSAVLQEVIDGAGWQQGNAVALILTGYGGRMTDAFDMPTGTWPLLHLEYSVDFVSLGVNNVEIDIAPGDPANELLPASDNPIQVAVLGGSVASGSPIQFDVTQVDVAKLRFGPAATAVGNGSLFTDIDGDSDTDLLVSFGTQDSGIACGDTAATLTGATVNGMLFESSDTVSTSDCESTGCHP